MRVDEKQVDGLDLEREEEQQQTLIEEHEESEFPEIAGEEVRDLHGERSSVLLDAIRTILEDEKKFSVSRLGLPQREARALEALQGAVSGRNVHLGTFVFAEDRRALLEQALAVLQPNLTSGDKTELAVIHDEMEVLIKRVAVLRHSLTNLEDAQDELMEGDRAVTKAADADTDDKPKPSDPDAPRPASTLSKGPEVKVEPQPSTLATGPEVKPESEAPSTLVTGPAIKPEPDGPTTLGDPAEIERAAAQLPWWRRPGG